MIPKIKIIWIKMIILMKEKMIIILIYLKMLKMNQLMILMMKIMKEEI